MPIDFSCSACGKKYRVKDELAGKTAKCSQCSGRIQIPAATASSSPAVKPAAAKAAAPQAAKAAATAAASRPASAAKSDDAISSWFDSELPVAAAAPLPAAALKSVAAAKSSAPPASAGPKKSSLCPSCRVPLASGAVVCVACGYDVRKGQKLSTKKGDDAADDGPAKKRSALGASASFARGAVFSAIGAAIGAAIWAGIGIALKIELGYVAIGLGALAGIGMAFGHDDKDGTLAGITAAAISIVGILLAKYIILQYLKDADLGEGISLAAIEQMTGESVPFSVMFSPMDGLFILLAVGAAYQLGSGQATD